MTAPSIYSMTGFGHAERAIPQGTLRAEIRTVNHRFFNLQARLPVGWESMQPAMDRLLRERVRRGHVAVTISRLRAPDSAEAAGEVAATVEVDLPKARGYLKALETLHQSLGLPEAPGLRDLLSFRDLIRVVDAPETEIPVSLDDIEALVAEALDQVIRMRAEEGGRLAQDLLGRTDRMAEALERIHKAAPDRLIRERDRLREAISRLLEDEREIPVDEDRLAREVAHLAERWDLEEELVRFRSHLQMFRDTLIRPGAEGAGKRLGFILQEILRETNTIGSKANDAGIQAEVIQLKEDIERLREQVENVE